MSALSVLFAFFVCIGHGRRVQTLSNATHSSESQRQLRQPELANSLQALASLLVTAHSPSAAWHSSAQVSASVHPSVSGSADGVANRPRVLLTPCMVTEVEEELDEDEQKRAGDPRHAPMFEWLEQGGAEIGPIVLAKSAIGDGYGGFATRDIEENEVIFTVPTAACINTYDACGDEEVGELLANITIKGQGGATVALACDLAKEWLINGSKGPRGPFLCLLPWERKGEGEQEHVVWWTFEQMKDLEGNSEALRDAWFVREEVDAAVRVGRAVLLPSVRKAYKEQGRNLFEQALADKDIQEAVRGAFISILSRSFVDSEEPDSELNVRLVPLLDMLQHGPENVDYETIVDDDTGEKAVEVYATKNISEGEEMFHNYNYNLSDSKFLSRFGFIPGTTVPEWIDALKKNRSFMANVFLNYPFR